MSLDNKYYGPFFITLASVMLGIDGGLLVGLYYKVFNFYDVRFIAFTAHFIPTILLSIVFFKKYKMLKIFTASDFMYLFLIALFGGTLGTLSIVKALQLSEFSKVSVVILLQKLQPVFAIIMAAIILKERPNPKFYLIAIIALFASYLLAFGFKSPMMLEKNNFQAAAFSMLAAFSYGSALVFGKKVLHKYDFITSTFYRFLFTTIIIGILVIFSGKVSENIQIYMDNRKLMFFALFTSLWGVSEVVVYYFGLKNTSASLASIFELSYPLTVVVLDAVLEKQFLTPLQIAAVVMLLGSILYLNINNRKLIKA